MIMQQLLVNLSIKMFLFGTEEEEEGFELTRGK